MTAPLLAALLRRRRPGRHLLGQALLRARHPAPKSGSVDPTKVNVAIQSGGSQVYLPGVADAAACGTSAGWYYDNPAKPTKVTLCLSSCDTAQASVGPGKPGHIEVLFGCTTIAQ